LSEARFAAHEVAEQWTGQKWCEGIMLLFLATTAIVLPCVTSLRCPWAQNRRLFSSQFFLFTRDCSASF